MKKTLPAKAILDWALNTTDKTVNLEDCTTWPGTKAAQLSCPKLEMAGYSQILYRSGWNTDGDYPVFVKDRGRYKQVEESYAELLESFDQAYFMPKALPMWRFILQLRRIVQYDDKARLI